ncbi:conserved hypothetical protein [Ricinus communis]|uniref:Uncharacterized protein n=1 Tax=Ricinus communis TaxID=3988 RepID=B9RLS3_RICCO|nr:conserved hypothetical protein [Ricinus communis]
MDELKLIFSLQHRYPVRLSGIHKVYATLYLAQTSNFSSDADAASSFFPHTLPNHSGVK